VGATGSTGPTGPAGPASSQIVKGENSSEGGTSTATCPKETILLGGGGSITNFAEGYSFIRLEPVDGGDGGSFVAEGSAKATVQAFAICTT
jgi:hypothetical protein